MLELVINNFSKRIKMRFIIRQFYFVLLVVGLLFFIPSNAYASHAMPLVGLTGTAGPTGITVCASSDGATCVGTASTPYWMQIEVTCNPLGFSGSAPASNSPLWGTVPWYHSVLNLPGYTGPYTEACVLEPYICILIPYSQLCPGTTYYWRAREFCEPTNSMAAWMGPFSFITPGIPPSAILSSVASQHTVCPGSLVQLGATVTGGCPGGTFNYSWAPNTGLSSTTIANPVATISTAITYTVTVTGGCFTITSNDDTVNIYMAPPVVAGIPTASPISVCSGQSSLVVLTGMSSNTIQWQVSPNGITWFNIPGATNDSLNTGPLSSPLYYHALVTGSGWPGTGCGTVASASVLVTVNASPVANAGPNHVICTGACVTLTGTGGVSYAWSPGNLIGASVSVCPPTNTIYTLTVTDINGCTATDNVVVILSTPFVNVSPNVTICIGSSTILFASGTNGNSYSWTPSATLVGALTANPSATPTTTTTYVVVATNNIGCTATDSVTVSVSAAPPISVSNDTTLCAGGSVVLLASGATTYSWQPGNFSGPSITVNPNTTVTYTVVGTSSNCTSSDSILISINAPPYVFAGPDFPICIGSQATMTASSTGNSFLWSPSIGIIGSNVLQSVVSAPLVNTSYTVTVIGPGGCISTDTINVTVNPTPIVTATSPDNTICVGLGTVLNGAGATSYLWMPAIGLGTPATASTTATPPNTTTYQVVGTDLNGCTDTTSITVIVNPLPEVWMIPAPSDCGDTTGSIALGATIAGTGPFVYAIGSTTYNNLPINNLFPGVYTVTTTDANGCVSSQPVSIGVINSSFVSAAANPVFGVYPLPVNFISSGSTGLNNFFWDLGTGSATASTELTSYTYTSPGTYTIVLTAWNDFWGCAVYDTITIVVAEQAMLTLPNVFTPNSDGTNDDFMATIIGVKTIKTEIFSRWGNRVFEGEQTNIASASQDLPLWDGKAANGNVCAEGVYYYVVTAIGYDTKDYNFSGFVHLFNSK